MRVFSKIPSYMACSMLYVACSTVVAAIALGLVFLAQYGFDLWPCQLCLYQRVPYFGLLGLGGVAWSIFKGRSILMLRLLIACWIISMGLAGYHGGVEAGFWSFGACTSPSLGAENLAALEAMIHHAKVIPCDRPAFVWMGLSMADMNLIVSGIMVVWGLWVLKVKRRQRMVSHPPS